jgi:hypothetical protein
MNPEYLPLCKKTYESIIKDGKITDDEWVFLMDLHHLIFNNKETDRGQIIKDIEKLAGYKIVIRR